MACEKDVRLSYFGEIHERIKVFNLIIDPFVFVYDQHVADVELKIEKNGLTFCEEKRKINVPFKG
jgi:hypothetical protein